MQSICALGGLVCEICPGFGDQQLCHGVVSLSDGPLERTLQQHTPSATETSITTTAALLSNRSGSSDRGGKYRRCGPIGLIKVKNIFLRNK